MLLRRENANFSTFIETDIYGTDDKIDIEKDNIMAAFTVQKVYSRENLEDEKYIAWVPQMIEGDGNFNEKRTDLEFRKCTDQDYKRFYKPNRDS